MPVGNGGGIDGPREQIRQLERRADVNDEEHRQIWQVQGATNATLSRIEERVERQRDDLITFERDCTQRFDKLDAKFDKWSGRQWMLLMGVILFALGAIGNLILLLANRGGP